jgi:nitric oxide reductase NorD protein
MTSNSPRRCSKSSARISRPEPARSSGVTGKSGSADKALEAIAALSQRSHREAVDVLPTIRRHGEQTVNAWLTAARRLLEYDLDAGSAFVHGTREAERISETVMPWTAQALRFLQWPAATAAIEGFMKNLPRAFGTLGHAGEPRWADIGLAWYARHAESGRMYFNTPVLDLAGRQGIAGVEQLCEPIEEMFERRKLMLATYLPGAIRVRNLLGAQAVLPWASRGADIMQAGRVRGEAYFRLESEESLSALIDHLPGFRMADRNHLLSLLLEIWFERSFELRESTWSPEKGRPFVETDGRSLFLPAVMADREEAILAVLHAAGRIVFGSFDRAALDAVFRETGLDLPDSGAISWAPLYERYGEDLLRFQLLFDLCDDLRIDCRIQRVVPNFLSRLQAAGVEHRVRLLNARPYYEAALASVRGALAHLRGETPGRDAGFDARLLPLLEPTATLADAFRIANDLYANSILAPVTDAEVFRSAYLPGRAPNAMRAVHAQQSDEQTQQTKAGADSEQENGDGNESREEEQNADTGGEQSAAQEKTVASDGKSSGSSRQNQQRTQTPDGNDKGGEKGKPYPEWDYREGRYKRNWCWVQEKPLTDSNRAEADRLMAQYAMALKRLKKAIQAQKPTRMAPKVRQFDGDDIDLNAMITYAAERHAGMSPEPSIYRRREIRQRDVSVTLLADMSTSIMQHLPEGGGRLVDRIRAGVLLFAESMEEVGDAYSIAGFASKYRDNVSYYTIKEFDQPLTAEVKSVIGGLSGRLATRMGAAIRHATARFGGVQSRRRLLLLLSDGRPEDYDDGGDRRYLHEDTRMAVKEAVSCGVHPFCITVDTMANQYLPQIFGPGHYMVLDHINSLPNKLPEIYLRLRR